MKVGLQQLDSILDRTHRHPPSKAVLPILAGFTSYNPHIRKKARDRLFTISRQLARLLETRKNPDRFRNLFVESSMFSARIYHEIRFNNELSENDVGIFFNVLVELGRPGQFYAWRIWQERFTVRPYLKSLVGFFPDKLKLAFVEQYLNASLSKRRSHARFFQDLLGNIKSRKAVIDFLADLFNRRKPLDPFWLNLNPALLDTDHLVSEELRSEEPENRTNAVTALYMIMEKPDPEVLGTLLKEDPAEKVRKAVLDIMGNAPPGTCESLIPLVLDRLPFMEKKEALAGFKAIASSLSYPPHKAAEVVRTERPDLMPEIFNEVSSFSRTAFLFAGDLIENPGYYNEKGKDLFREMVKGLIHRHPKALLETARATDHKRFNKSLNAYIQKEEQRFHSFIRGGEDGLEKIKSSAPASEKNLSRFTEARRKALEKEGTRPVHCRNTYFHKIDFSGEITDSLSFVFDKSCLNRCSLADTRFRKSSFNRTIFRESDLDSTVFRRSSFDDAVFINVRAQNTRFIGCSFHRASFYKCSFTGAKLFHSVFSRTRISRSDFTRTDIFGSSFTGARLFETSFENSRLRETDFSGARAKECKWNPSADTEIRSAYADFHTGFVPGFNGGIPDFNFNDTVRISQLIRAQFADFGRELFMIKNRNVLLAACDIFPSKTYDIFEMIPLLLHENINFPGHNGMFHHAPHGIRWYSPSDRSLETAKKYLGGRAVKEGSEPDIPHIQGLFSIGSTGTIAQSSASDIDYWVCIEESQFTAGMKNALEEKLEKLESWARDFFKTEIHFFILDINRLKENDFGKTSPHSSGSAQATILKDEFYRTMIHIAGRVPLWATLPSAVSCRSYDFVHDALKKLPSSGAYIDLGDVQSISGNEFYGALIWQIFKGIKSSFKSVIKMALVEKYLYTSQDTPLLCNQLKDRWLHSPSCWLWKTSTTFRNYT